MCLKHIFKWTLAISIALFTITLFAANEKQSEANTVIKTSQKSEQELQLFYQQPTFSKFIHITSNLINEPKGGNLLLIFSTMVVNKHPDYASQITENFQQYSSKEQRLLYESLLASGNKTATDYINKTYNYKPGSSFRWDVTPPFTANDIKNLKINDNPNNLDVTWLAFFATGDDLYLKKILEYINSDDYTLLAGYEIVNRKYLCDVMKH